MKKITKERIVDIPINKAYAMWTTREGVSKFFGEDAKIELKKQGAYEIYFNLSWEKGYQGSEGCEVVNFEPNQYISFTWNVPPMFTAERAQKYHSVVVIEFFETKDNKVRIKLTNEYKKIIDNLEEIINYFDKAWDYVLNNFVMVVSK